MFFKGSTKKLKMEVKVISDTKDRWLFKIKINPKV